MRIIAGRFKGRRLAGPDGAGVRPTSDALRETLFNVLGPSVTGARVLDGYAGTGALGLEALSRGAAHVTFVDAQTRAARVIASNVERCGAGNACVIIRGDFLAFAPRAPYDLVLLDPPYDGVDPVAVLDVAERTVTPDGRVVLEHHRRREVPASAGRLRRTRTLVAGDSALSFYSPEPDGLS